MKKSLSVILSSAMALSMFSSVAFGKTSADFTDLKNLPPEQKAIFDAMISAGIFDGVTDTTFGLNDDMNRAQFAKIAAKLLGLDATGTTSSFTDVKASDPANGYAVGAIEALKAKGITDGVTDTTFDPAGKVTKEQLAAFLIRAIGKDAEAKLTPGVSDATVSTWAKGYVAFAINAKLVTNGADGTFGGTTNASRTLLVLSSAAAKTAIDAAQATSIASVTATGAKKLEVKFNKAVDTTKAAFTVARGSNAVTVASITWSDDKTKATINTSAKLFAGDYTVSVSGVSTAALTSTYTAKDEATSKITISSDKAAIIDAPTNQNLTVSYKVANQYGEDITSTTNVSATSSVGTATPDTSKGTVTISAYSPFTLDQKIALTLVQPDTAISATQVLSVSPAAAVASVQAVKLYNASGSTLTADSDLTTYEIVVKAVDQYGNNITDPNLLKNQVLVSVSNPTVAGVTGLSNNKAIWNTDSVDGSTVAVLKLAGTPTVGSSVVTLIAASTGSTANLTVNVADGVVADNVTFGTLDNVVAAGDGVVNLPVTVTDKAGNEITDLVVLNGTKGATVTGIAGKFTKVNGKIVYQFTAPSTAQTIVLTAVSKTTKVASKTIVVKDAALPAVITGFTSDVSTGILIGQSQTVKESYLTVQDQYGRAMTSTAFAAAVGGTSTGTIAAGSKYAVKVTEGSTDVTSPVGSTVTALNDITTQTVINAVYKGNETVSFTLQKVVGATTTNVSGSDLVANFRSVATSEIASYQIADIADVYKNANYVSSFTVNGVTKDGKSVPLPASMYTASVNNGAITSGKLDMSGVVFTNVYAPDSTSKDVTLTVVINSTGDTLTKAFKAVTAAPAVSTIALRDASNIVITNLNITGTTFALSNIAGSLYAKDQYGKEYTNLSGINTTTGVITFADTTTTATPKLTISNINYGSNAAPTITNNGTSGLTVTGLAVNDTFTLTIASGSGTATVNVTVTP